MIRKTLLLAAILAFVACFPAPASATQQLDDNTLIQEFEYGGDAPKNLGWKDVAGKPAYFQTTHIDVSLGTNRENVTFVLYTNMNSGGYSLYRPADLAIDLNQDGTFETAISLYKGNLWSYAHNTDVAHQYEVGRVYNDVTWLAPEYFYNGKISTGPVSSYGAYATPIVTSSPNISTIVWMASGTEAVGYTSQYAWDTENNTWYDKWSGNLVTTKYKITITLLGINAIASENGEKPWDEFDLFWGTATCSNDAITGRLKRIEMVPIPSTVWLMASGLVGLAGLRRRSKR